MVKQSQKKRDEKEEKGWREKSEMWCCCHNETMLEDKPRLISWLKCKSSKYGEEQTGKQAKNGEKSEWEEVQDDTEGQKEVNS